MKRVFTAICLLFVCSYAHAGGSFDLDDQLLPLLKQKPELMDYLMSTLDIEPHGVAARIGRTVNSHLGGTRIGPYQLCAKPKGQKGAYTLQLTFHTSKVFLDSNGKPADFTTGVKVVETLTSVEITTLTKASNKPMDIKPKARALR